MREQGKGASLFGYTSLYGSVPGGQAEYLRVPQAQYGPIKVPEGVPDERFLYLSDILPTAWQAVEYADVAEGEHPRRHRARSGRPVGRPDRGQRRAAGSSASTSCPSGCALAAAHGVEVIDLDEVDDVAEAVLAGDRRTRRRTAPSTRSAWRRTARPWQDGHTARRAACPTPRPQTLTDKAGVDRTGRAASPRSTSVRRGGTVSISGVYGGEVDPMPMMEMFDQRHQLRHGPVPRPSLDRRASAAARRADDLLGVESLGHPPVPLEEAPAAYEMFQQKKDGCVKVVLRP